MWLRLSCLIGAVVVSGCSFQYTDDLGHLHILGFVHQVVEAENDRLAGAAIRTETLGAAVVQTIETTSFSIGYSVTSVASFKEDVCYAEEMDGPLSQILWGKNNEY